MHQTKHTLCLLTPLVETVLLYWARWVAKTFLFYFILPLLPSHPLHKHITSIGDHFLYYHLKASICIHVLTAVSPT